MTNSVLSSDEKQAILKRAATNQLINFCEIVDEKYEANWHHEVIAAALQKAWEDVKRGKSRRIIIELPPRNGKSNLATLLFPAWVLGKNPDIPIIVTSYAAELSEDFGRKTRDIMNSDAYRAIFETRLRDDSKAKGKWLTKENGGYTAAGVGGPITGKGFKIGIVDDPFKNREEAESELMREKVWDWWTSTFYTRQEGVSLIVVIMTRWHTDDLVARLEAQENELRASGEKHFDEWEFITFPAIAEDDEEHRKAGEALWPKKFNLEQLTKIQNSIGVYDWSSLYQQHPVPAGQQEFDSDWFQTYDPVELRGMHLDYYTLIDPAVGEGEESDNSVVLTIAKQRNGPNWYRIEEAAGHMNPIQLIDAIFFHQKKYRSKVWLETIAYQKALKYFMIEEQKKRNQYFLVNELRLNYAKSKASRVRGLIPLYGARVIYHRRDDEAYERELMEFPFGKRDDRIDCMASGLEAVAHTDYDDGDEDDGEITLKDMDVY